MKQLSVIILGGGGRGTTYSKYMAQMPQHYRIVGIAEPDPARREKSGCRWCSDPEPWR